MGARGPRPTPTSILRGRGSWRAKARSGTPEPKASPPPPPRWLAPAARQHWSDLSALCAELGVLSEADGPALALFSEALADYVEVAKRLRSKTEGLTVENDHGTPRPNPLCAMRDRSWERVLKCCQEFGLSPAARARVKVEATREISSDPTAKFFGGA